LSVFLIFSAMLFFAHWFWIKPTEMAECRMDTQTLHLLVSLHSAQS
jgi:hypothetical protein